MGFNIDAEEADRLALSLDVIEAVFGTGAARMGWLWRGRAGLWAARGAVIDALHDMAKRLDRKIMVRLVKGAYWDAEIKRAQVDGHRRLPGLHQQNPHRYQLYRQRTQTAGHDRPDLSAVCHAQRAHRRCGPRHRRADGPHPAATNSSACTAWAKRCTRSS